MSGPARRQRNDLIVGVTIIVAVVALLGATLWMKQADVGRKRTSIHARFRDVGGIQLGNPVVIRGVRAGRIDQLYLANGGWVVARMSLEKATPLPADPVVLLSESSLFGEWQATITDISALPPDRDIQKQILESRSAEDGLPGATLPDLARLTTVAGRIAGDVASVASRVEVAFDDRAATELRTSIRNAAELSTQLASAVKTQSRNLDAVALDLRAGISSVRQAAAGVERVAARADSSTATGQVKQIVRDVGVAADQLKSTTARLDEMTRRLDVTQQRLDEMLGRADSVMVKINGGGGSLGLLINDPSLYRNSDTLVVQMRRLLADIQANPKRYVNVKLF
jgi:phospholipid/cholesterol/gamma-HCH transport system substrate-binding protein